MHKYISFAEQEAEVEEERLRREREERDRQDAMTLGETKEQIQILNTRLKELRNEKQQLFLRLKKVLNEDENRKKQQQQKERHVGRTLVEINRAQFNNIPYSLIPFTVRCTQCSKVWSNNRVHISRSLCHRVHRISCQR